MTCVRCRGKAHVRLLPLPVTGERMALCIRCVGPAFLGHMRALIRG